MVSIITDNKIIYRVEELDYEIYCNQCEGDTYLFVEMYGVKLCPSCAINQLIEPFCACGNLLKSTTELKNGVCKECQ